MQTTFQLIASLFSNILNFTKSINVPGFDFTFYEFFVAVFLFCVICNFIYEMLAFGGNNGNSK